MQTRNTLIRYTAAAVLAAGLSACAPEWNPPEGYQGGFLWGADRSRTVTVEQGDTLYTVSRRYDVPTRVLIARNGLQPPYILSTGQTLIIDAARSHKVAEGDTLSEVAQRYGVDMAMLAEWNGLTRPYTIRTGQTLWIPDPFAASAGSAVASSGGLEPPPPRSAPRSAISSTALPPPSGSVDQSGFGNPPMTAPMTSAPSQPMTYPTAPSTDAPVVMPPLGAPVQVGAGVGGAVTSPQVASLPSAAVAPSAFTWPLQGKVIASFGPAGRGLHNDGINIAAPAGAEVRAAADGTVTYAGNELKGFGNLLLIKHTDGWTTAYAHNDQLLVQRGAEVKQGQVIARVGRTGNVDSPQLHFEIRRGTQAIDPMTQLAAPRG